jgi:hypothetical protein
MVFDMSAELPEKEGPGSFKKTVDYVKNKCKKRSSRDKYPDVKISSSSKTIESKEFKKIAFRHAGYDSNSFNTVMFHLTGSESYSGGVRGSTLIMILLVLIGQEAMHNVRFGLRRGTDFIHIHRNTILRNSDYYIHCVDPDDPSNYLYRYPLTPCLRMWTVPKIMIDLWTCDGRKSIVGTSSKIILQKTNEQQLRDVCDNAVEVRDQRCVLTGQAAKYCERAYLTPTSETDFYMSERLGMYMGGRSF